MGCPTGRHDASPCLFAEHNRSELGEMAEQGTILVLPVGATEQHGPHLPVWTDSLVAEHLALSAAHTVARELDVVVAPTLSFGSSDHHLPFGATLSLSTSTLLAVLMDLGRSVVRSGFSRLFLLNGHGGNDEIIQLAVRDLAQQHEIHAAAGSWWRIADAAITRDTAARDFGRVPGHAGAFETAVVRALRPELVSVHMPALRDALVAAPRSGARWELRGSWLRTDGYTDQPGAMDATHGKQIVDAAILAVADELRRFNEACVRVPLHRTDGENES